MGFTCFLIHNLPSPPPPPHNTWITRLSPLAILVAPWTINRSIHRSNYYSTHRSLHQAISHVCLIVMYAWTTHLSHLVILCPSLSFPNHRSILPTINWSIHRSNHHSTHRSLHQAIYHVCLLVMYAWTIHLSHPVIMCLETSFPHHRSILSTINRSIHRSNHHFTHYSLHHTIFHDCLLVVYTWITHLSHPIIMCLEISFPHHRSLLPSYFVFSGCTIPFAFLFQNIVLTSPLCRPVTHHPS